ncbi:hypothetical protein [Kiloniella sp.]|uniref:hypothetical protein n=1 Tax=Kiloniella sp. TaxID=1938587 RepID=UPI003B0199D8
MLAIEDNIVFLVSFGQGYLFDINGRKLLHKTDCDYLVNIISGKYKKYFIASTLTDIIIYKEDEIWSSDRVSSDGINFTKINNNVLHGEIYDFSNWVPFTLNLETFEYKCSWEFPF